jgi:hypothetical protein
MTRNYNSTSSSHRKILDINELKICTVRNSAKSSSYHLAPLLNLESSYFLNKQNR